MSKQAVIEELETRGIRADEESIETISWFTDNNPQMNIDDIIRDYFI